MQGSQGWRPRAALLLVSSILSSCTIMRGAPKPPLPAELLKPDSSDQTLTLTTADLAALEAAQSTEERNRIAVKAMLAIDLR